MSKGNNVRLTDQAHILCAEKAGYSHTSMKAVASEAIVLLVRGDNRNKEQQKDIEIYKRRVAVLAKRIQDNRHAAFGTFVLGAIIGGALMFFMGV